MFFQKKALNNVDSSLCNPIIINDTDHSIVVFLDRGVLYNKQVLAPGEAVGMTRKETAGSLVPYKVHAVVGDEKSLPTEIQSFKNALSTLVIPTAFVAGTLMAASTAGTSRAATGVASRIVIRGMVIDSAALAAGSLSASRAALVANQLVEQHPENYSVKSGLYLPGNRYVVIRGGIDKPMTITTIKEKKFHQLPIAGALKSPMDTLKDQIEYYTPSFLRFSKTKDETDSGAIEAETREQIEGQSQQERTKEAKDVAKREPPSTSQRSSVADDILEQEMLRAIEGSLEMEEERKRELEAYERRLKETRKSTHSAVLF